MIKECVTALAIVGGREFKDKEFLEKEVDKLLLVYPNIDTVVSGGAFGADTLGENYAKKLGLKTKIYRADWNGPKGKGAGIARNKDIVANSHVILAFWNGTSRGTKNTVERARGVGKRVLIRYNKGVPLAGGIKKKTSK